MNYSIKIDLLKLKNTCATNLKGKTETKRCLIIPIDDNSIFVGEKGIYLDLTAFELQEKRGQSHILKVNIPKEVRDAMSEEERKAQPIVGGMKEIAPVQPTPMNITAQTGSAQFETFDDLPF